MAANILDVCFDAIAAAKLFIMTHLDEYFTKEDVSLKTDKFISTPASDYDYRCYERVFTGRMTKARWKIIDRFCRLHSFRPRYRCGHDWDCCGCFCGQSMSFEYKHNQVSITFTQSFNY